MIGVTGVIASNSAVAPVIAVISDDVQLAIVGGFFGLANTILYAVLNRRAKYVQDLAESNHAILNRRGTEQPPPDGEWKREEDPPEWAEQSHS